jgi:O-antigen/teichoic acid export membrane protein
MLSVVASLRYEVAILLPDEEKDASALVVLALGICLGMALLTASVVWLWGVELTSVIGALVLRPYLWLLPVGVGAVGAYQALSYWALRIGAFSTVARTKVSQGLVSVAFQLGIGLLFSGPLGLLVGDLMGRTSGIMLLIMKTRHALVPMSIRDIVQVTARYRRFPLMSSFSAVMNSAALRIPPLMLSATYGTRYAGCFLLTQRVVGAPLALIGQAVAQVYTATAAQLLRQKPHMLRGLFLKTGLWIFSLGSFPIGVMAWAGPWVFPPLFGREWKDAGQMARLLAPMHMAGFVAVPLSQTLNVIERQDIQLLWDVTRFIMVACVMLGGRMWNLSVWWVVGLYGISMGLMYAWLLVLGYQYSRGNTNRCRG